MPPSVKKLIAHPIQIQVTTHQQNTPIFLTKLLNQTIGRRSGGKKARDSLLLGMYSIHLDGTGEYWGNGSNNDQGHMLGIRYCGLTAGTFINSEDDRAWFLGPAREVYSRDFSDDGRFDIGYSFGLLYGYGDDLINLGGMSVFGAATFGITWHKMGFDLGIIPVGIFTANFRIDID